MAYNSETHKIREKALKYVSGKKVMDVGCGHDPITPEAFGVDARAFPHVRYVTTDVANLSKSLRSHQRSFDVVYSSHALEHFDNDIACLKDWSNLLVDGGIIFLYLPDDRYYDNDSNPEHKQRYTESEFVQKIGLNFPHWRIVENGLDVGDDRYSFYVAIKVVHL